MSTETFDLYSPIHKALRRIMSRLIEHAGTTDWTNAGDAAAVQAEWDLAMRLVASHHHHEEEYIHPLLASAAPGGQRQIEREHEEQSQVRGDLAAYLDRLGSEDIEPDAKQRMGKEFVCALYAYYADLLKHMRLEEVDAQRTLDAHYSVAQLADTNKRIVRSVPPDEIMLTVDAMFPALSLNEQAGILGGIRADAPPPAFAAICARVQAAIGEQGWAALSRRVGLQ